MSLNKALEFVEAAGSSEDVRNKCCLFENKQIMLRELDFNETEFDDAINMNLVKCQSYEQAEVFQQLKMWFSIL